jgi:hypothetical protein
LALQSVAGARANIALWCEAAVKISGVMSEIKVGPDEAPTPAGFASAG